MSHSAFHRIVISGPDALSFLQGQLTCDVTKSSAIPSLAAYCDIKGRVLANFWITHLDAAYQLYLPCDMVECVMTTLKKYGIFSKVTIAAQPVDAMPAAINLSYLEYIQKGIVFIVPATSLLFTPQMINLEKLGGVSFDKGCYLGQEVVARTQHLGQLKRHLYRFQCVAEQVPGPGDKLVNTQQEGVGVVCDAIFDGDVITGLAVMQDQALTAAMLLNGQTLPAECVSRLSVYGLMLNEHKE